MTEEALDIEDDVEDTDLEAEVEDDDEQEGMYVVGDDKDEPDEDEKKDSSEKEVNFKDLQSQFNTQAEEMKTLNSELENRDKEIKRIAYQLRTVKKEDKATDEQPEFTDAQLQGLLEQHKDDPAAMLQIMKLVAKETSRAGDKKTIDEVQVSSNKKEMDAFLTKTYPDLANEGSEFKTNVDSTKDYLGISDHPYGDFFAVGTMVLNNLEGIVAHAREEGKAAALTDKAEDTRKKGIKSNSLSAVTGKKGKTSVSSSKYLKVAKQMGLSKTATERYLKSMSKAKEA